MGVRTGEGVAKGEDGVPQTGTGVGVRTGVVGKLVKTGGGADMHMRTGGGVLDQTIKRAGEEDRGTRVGRAGRDLGIQVPLG